MGAARRAVRQRSKPHQDGRAVHSVDLAHQGMGSIRTLPQAAHMLDGRQQTLYQLQVARDGLGDSHTGQYSTYWPPWQVHQPRGGRVLLMSVETWRFRSMCGRDARSRDGTASTEQATDLLYCYSYSR